MPLAVTLEAIRELAIGYELAKSRERNSLHLTYDETVCMYEDLRVHADGDTPVELISERRPSESQYIQEYRMKIWVPITKSSVTKVISSLSKIRRSPDWNIAFPKNTVSKIRKGETLEDYITKNYPFGFSNLTNWVFSVLLKNYLIDSNAVIFVDPINKDKEAVDYFKPFPYIFNSPKVLDFVADEYAVLMTDRCCEYSMLDGKGYAIGATKKDGKVIIYVDKTSIIIYHQKNSSNDFIPFETHVHNLGFMPAFKMPGQFYRSCDNYIVNESRINGMLPHLKEAARIYSDLQAEIVQHVHSEKYLYSQTECNHCNGVGWEEINGARCDCHNCSGVGYVPTSPYKNMVLRVPNNAEGGNPVPTPPAGYIQKTDVALMVDRIDSIVDKHLFKALAAINMQFLDETPLNESGKAKEVDKDELNNFVHSVAEDLVKVMDLVIFTTNEYRVKDLVTDPERRLELLPMVSVPEKFDLLSTDFLVEEIAKAKQNNLNSLIISTLETEYAVKKFYNMPDIAQLITLVFSLDPMPATTDEMKIMRLQNEGVTREDYVISSNIVPFIRRALREDEDFATLDYDEQMTIIRAYATEKIDSSSVASRVTPPIEEDEEVIIEP